MTRLVLLDRDGVINRDSDAFIRSTAEFEPLSGALEAMADLSRAGLLLGVCTNQSGVARGLLTEADLAAIHADLRSRLAALGGRLDTLHYCPHAPDAGCDCRKPRPGMLLAAMAELNVPPEETVFVGDALRDVEAALAAGCSAALVRTGKGKATEARARTMGPIAVYDDLRCFADALLAGMSGTAAPRHGPPV